MSYYTLFELGLYSHPIEFIANSYNCLSTINSAVHIGVVPVTCFTFISLLPILLLVRRQCRKRLFSNTFHIYLVQHFHITTNGVNQTTDTLS